MFCISLAVNSNAQIRPEESGSATDIALMKFIDRCGIKYEDLREKA